MDEILEAANQENANHRHPAEIEQSKTVPAQVIQHVWTEVWPKKGNSRSWRARWHVSETGTSVERNDIFGLSIRWYASCPTLLLKLGMSVGGCSVSCASCPKIGGTRGCGWGQTTGLVEPWAMFGRRQWTCESIFTSLSQKLGGRHSNTYQPQQSGGCTYSQNFERVSLIYHDSHFLLTKNEKRMFYEGSRCICFHFWMILLFLYILVAFAKKRKMDNT